MATFNGGCWIHCNTFACQTRYNNSHVTFIIEPENTLHFGSLTGMSTTASAS